MSMSDPVADMLTRVRNAGKAKLGSVDIPGSKLKVELAKVMQGHGFIKNYKFIEDSKQGILRIYLKYTDNNEHVILGLSRESKPGRRSYSRCRDIKPVLNGLGISVFSTSKGIMTDKQARRENIGGEVLCSIW